MLNKDYMEYSIELRSLLLDAVDLLRLVDTYGNKDLQQYIDTLTQRIHIALKE